MLPKVDYVLITSLFCVYFFVKSPGRRSAGTGAATGPVRSYVGAYAIEVRRTWRNCLAANGSVFFGYIVQSRHSRKEFRNRLEEGNTERSDAYGADPCKPPDFLL